jgi:hypothetical protein
MSRLLMDTTASEREEKRERERWNERKREMDGEREWTRERERERAGGRRAYNLSARIVLSTLQAMEFIRSYKPSLSPQKLH